MKKHYLLAASIWLSVSFSASAQNQKNEQAIFPTNAAALKELGEKSSRRYEEGMVKARILAKSLGVPMRQVDKNGRIRQVVGVDEFGYLEFVETDNLVAATSIGTNKVWPLAGNGFNLTGKSFRAHEWDGGRVRTSHVEFGGRVTLGDNSAEDFHPTHVAGTIIASGVNPSARGMAYEATLTAYDFNNHVAEMTAIAQEMLVSNHSYGTIGGWRLNGSVWDWNGIPSVSETLDPKFGVYDQTARDWDILSYNAPYYLIVKSAGNSRDDGPAPGTNHRLPYVGGAMSTTTRPRNGPYDILTTYTTAKNILTIAAVQDVPNGYLNPVSVGMSSFSSWGPTDDGRIKPDISTNGTGVLSTSNAGDNAYESSDGTSMASPGATGSLLLLQQHYSNRFGTPMISSLLKALVCHTADEAGAAEGPDYAFGWGLMNTHKAATAINQHNRRSIVTSKRLLNGGVETVNVVATGRGPLTATIAWTDPAAAALSINVLNNRTPLLINDLDLRIIGPNGAVTYLPYTLDFANPASAAQKADNFRDNVEKVFLANPVAGNYQIRISHKGNSLTNNGQDYGLVVTGIATADTAITCSGNYIFNATSGTFSDGSEAKPYSNNLNCNWLINLKDTAARISLKFNQLSVAAGDTVYLYNGIDASGPLIGKYSGNTPPPAWISASADKVFVRFMSNASGTADGFTLRYTSGIRPKVLLRKPGSPYSCINRNLVFSAAPLIPDTTGWQYNWTFLGAITPNFTTPSVAVNYAQPGIYGYKLVITNISGRSITYQEDSIVWVRPIPGTIRNRFSESFENPNFPFVSNRSDSIFEIIGNEFETWQRTTDAAHDGSASMVVKNFGTTPGTVRELVLPSINMTTRTAPYSIRYFIAHAAETTTATDRLRILVSTDCGQNWTQRGVRSNNSATSPLFTVSLPVTGGYIPAPTDWRRDTLNLIAYQNSANLLIKFEMSGNMSDNLYIDNISIGNPTSNKSRFGNITTWMRATPNPYAQQLSIAYQIPVAGKISLKLVDMLGRSHLVEQTYRSVGEFQTQLPESLTSLPTGMYILRLEGDGFISNLKVIKK